MKNASATHIDVHHAGGSSAQRRDGRVGLWTDIYAAARAGWGLWPMVPVAAFVPVAGHLPAGRLSLGAERRSSVPAPSDD